MTGDTLCCEQMRTEATRVCETHPDRTGCPDCIIVRRGDEYGIAVHDGGDSRITIAFCPWCGKKLDTEARGLRTIKQVLRAVDDELDHMLKRPGMFAGDSAWAFELLVHHSLSLRAQLLGSNVEYREIERTLLWERFRQGLGNLSSGAWLRRMMGDDVFSNRDNPRHDEFVDFYRELVSRVRKAQGDPHGTRG